MEYINQLNDKIREQYQFMSDQEKTALVKIMDSLSSLCESHKETIKRQEDVSDIKWTLLNDENMVFSGIAQKIECLKHEFSQTDWLVCANFFYRIDDIKIGYHYQGPERCSDNQGQICITHHSLPAEININSSHDETQITMSESDMNNIKRLFGLDSDEDVCRFLSIFDGTGHWL